MQTIAVELNVVETEMCKAAAKLDLTIEDPGVDEVDTILQEDEQKNNHPGGEHRGRSPRGD